MNPRRGGPVVIIGGIALSGCALLFMLAVGVVFIYRGAIVSYRFNQYNQTGNSYYEQGDFARALDAYNKMIELKPQATQGYFLRAWVYYRTGKYRLAISDYTSAIEREHHAEWNSAAYYNRGLCNQALGKWPQAVADFTTAISLQPNIRDAYEARGWCRYKENDLKGALADIDIAIHEKQKAKIYDVRGDIDTARGDRAQAIEDYTRAIELDPHDTQAYFGRMNRYSEQKDFDRAIADARSLVRMMPGAGPAWGDLGWEQYLAGKLDTAISTDQKALGLSGNNVFVRYNLGLCYAVKGDWNQAKKQYTIALSHSSPADLSGSLGDVTQALKQRPDSAALKQADQLLRSGLVSH